VAPGCAITVAAALAERLRLCVCESPVDTSIGEVSVTMSLGVAAQSDTMPGTLLLRAADQALYRAKSAGRNRVEVAYADVPPLESH
jgi:diguanylate cyclase (GGDEF)-like protein